MITGKFDKSATQISCMLSHMKSICHKYPSNVARMPKNEDCETQLPKRNIDFTSKKYKAKMNGNSRTAHKKWKSAHIPNI